MRVMLYDTNMAAIRTESVIFMVILNSSHHVTFLNKYSGHAYQTTT